MSEQDLALEPFTGRHFATLASWFTSHRDVLQWGGPAVRYPLTAEQMQAMLPDREAPPSRLAWIAVRSGACVGHAQVMRVDSTARTARLGRIAVAPTSRGQGLAVPMLRLVIDEIFALPTVDRVDLGVYTWNVGAIKTYERVGFRSVDTRLAATIYAGESWSSQQMALYRSA